MARPFPVIDADGHVIERDRELREFLPDPTGGARGSDATRSFPGTAGRGAACRPIGASIPIRRAGSVFSMHCGITATVLYPSDGLSLGLLHDADRAVPRPRLQRLVAPVFSPGKPRFQGVALLPVQEPPGAAKELERCVRDLGMVGGMLVGGHESHARLRPAAVRADLGRGRAT